jgi:hypothetical protein
MNEKDKTYRVDREAVHAEIRKGLKSILPKDHDAELVAPMVQTTRDSLPQ